MGTLENDKTWLYKALTQDHNINSDNLASNEREKFVGTKHYQSSSSFFFLSAIPHTSIKPSIHTKFAQNNNSNNNKKQAISHNTK